MYIELISLLVSVIGITISIWSVRFAKKMNREVMRQNLEAELSGIESKIRGIDAQISQAKAEGERNNTFYGCFSNPNQGQIDSLNKQKDALLKRKYQINRTLSSK